LPLDIGNRVSSDVETRWLAGSRKLRLRQAAFVAEWAKLAASF
jgi:hypothetical protein